MCCQLCSSSSVGIAFLQQIGPISSLQYIFGPSADDTQSIVDNDDIILRTTHVINCRCSTHPNEQSQRAVDASNLSGFLRNH